MTNHLAAELRGILDDLHDAENGTVPKSLVRERLEQLTEHVEQVATEPAELEAVHAGLEPEQEIRDRGLERAIELAHNHGAAGRVLLAAELPAEATVVDLADVLAAYIRDGSRP